MDVTPQLLKDVDFREKKFGGYDPDEVDDFLERVGVAIGQLQMRLRGTTQRAEAAEARLAQAPPPAAPAETDDTLRRTLLLAQRTADAAVAEAQEESTRLVTTAQEEADRLVAEAQEAHDRQLRESEDEVRRAVDETRDRLLQEIHALEGIRDQLMSDVESLERHVDDERARLVTTVASLQALLDAAGSMAPIQPPDLSGVVSPVEPEPNFAAPEDTGIVIPSYEPAPPYEPPMAETPREEAPLAEAPAVDAPPAFDLLPPAPAFGEPGSEPDAAPAEPSAPSVWDTPAEDVFAADPPAAESELFQQPPPPPPPPAADAPAGFGGLGGPVADPWAELPNEGTSTQSMDAIAADAGGDNPWMADVARDAMANQPPPPVDDQDAMAEWYRQQEEAADKPEKHKRFGRKK